MSHVFNALEVVEINGVFTSSVVEKRTQPLAEGEVLIQVAYSSLNYKDALSAMGHPMVTQNFPHTPGIDAAGVVVESAVADWQVGDEVIVTGFDLGMNTDGGFGGYIRVPSEWLVKMPKGLSPKESMMYGTAGFTAGLCVHAIVQHGVKPSDGAIAVTGATGGVGSIAVAILSKLGYSVSAVSGKPAANEFLKQMGATEIIARAELDDQSGSPFLPECFAAAVDTVGGNMLATVMKSLHYGGVAATCGFVNGSDLPLSIFPFIVKGVQLVGIDSVQIPMAKRLPVWELLADEWKPVQLPQLVHEIGLSDLPRSIELILQGQMQGRALVHVV